MTKVIQIETQDVNERYQNDYGAPAVVIRSSDEWNEHRGRPKLRFTAAEHRVLNKLASNMIEYDLMSEVIFGESEEGDEWCSICDCSGEGRIHFLKRGDNKVTVYANSGEVQIGTGDLIEVVARVWGVVSDSCMAAAKATGRSADIISFEAILNGK